MSLVKRNQRKLGQKQNGKEYAQNLHWSLRCDILPKAIITFV